MLQAFVQANFTTSPYNGYQSAIDAGDPILTQVFRGYVAGVPQWHEVLIVGYDASNTTASQLIYYMDPGTGQMGSMTNQQLNTQNPQPPLAPEVITGKK